jgi:hypothetical protein
MSEDRERAAAFDAVGMARGLIRTARHGSLGTIDGDGRPFTSLVALSTDLDGVPIIITSHLSHHTGHLDANGRMALLIADLGKGDPLAHPRVTLTGRAVAARTDTPAYPHLRRRYLTRNPKAELYVDLPGFWFWRLEPEAVALNGGFGKAWNGSWSEIATDLLGAETLVQSEAGAVQHMNDDHADAVALYATRLCGMPEARWRCTGLDPEGIDMAAGDLTARLAFPERITAPGQLRMALKVLADRARAA